MTATDLKKLREYLQYDAQTDGFVWLKRFGNSRVKVGNSAGWLDKVKGYVRIMVTGKKYLAHRLWWSLTHGTWPKSQIDHINGERSNNRLDYLRDVSSQENSHNRQKLSSKNTSGYYGICWDAQTQKWRAAIVLNIKKMYLCLYATALEASAACEQVKLRYHPTAPVSTAS